jgi:hypothetical protein
MASTAVAEGGSMTTLPRLGVGSILRRAKDGKGYVVRSIRKAEPHSGASAVLASEPSPEPLPFKRRKRRHRLNEQYFPDYTS